MDTGSAATTPAAAAAKTKKDQKQAWQAKTSGIFDTCDVSMTICKTDLPAVKRACPLASWIIAAAAAVAVAAGTPHTRQGPRHLGDLPGKRNP
ncbi:hypothetical protein CNYM01_05675 [Colletotrichum nymphaeae SA-01]|uniref:Uncharacterized protein n=1 Tax=Colletotrichum nymphaeae SA-01 TaxID=1460502 RepID=A0A135US40_9PEZI|nr:hypothetical protein CNYM01_05675 [Colletotrichum nymphaeae SA-01]